MSSNRFENIKEAWDELNTLVPVSPIRNERQYGRAVKKLNELLDIVGDDERHPLYDLLDGKRELSVDYIRQLSKRFGLSPATFFE